MPIDISSEQYFAVVLQIKGKFFGSRDGEEFKKAVEDLKAAGKKNIVVDLSKTELMDSSGIGVLIMTATKLREEGGDMKLAHLETKMKNLFLMTRLLGQVFQGYDTTEEAIQSFAP